MAKKKKMTSMRKAGMKKAHAMMPKAAKKMAKKMK